MKNLINKIITPFLVAGALFGKVQAQDNQINAFHQPNIVYDQLNSYGGGESNSTPGIDQGDADAANAGTEDYRLDVNGDEQVNVQDGTTLQSYVNGTESKLPAWWNFSTKEEKVDWLDKTLAIDKTDTTTYRPGEFISGDFGAQLYLNFQGFSVKSQEEMELIAQKYDTTNFGRYNIPVYHVASSGHGMNACLVGDNPLDFYDWQFIEPQQDKYNHFKNFGENWNPNIGDEIGVYCFNELGDSNGNPSFSTEKLVQFKIDSTGTPVLDGDPNPNLLLTKPSVATEYEKSTPQNYILGDNYPNPFNANTSIPYSFDNEVDMSMDLYNIKGQHIRNLEYGVRQAGDYVGNINTGNLPSGNYIITLTTTDGFNKSLKISLVK